MRARRFDESGTASGKQERGVVVVVGNLMPMAVIGMDDANYLVMGVIVYFNLGVMLGNGFSDLRRIVQHAACAWRQDDRRRQSDGQCKA